jgi:hypothetical protein
MCPSGNVNKGLDVLPSILVGWTQAKHAAEDCELLSVVTTRSERKNGKNVLLKSIQHFAYRARLRGLCLHASGRSAELVFLEAAAPV